MTEDLTRRKVITAAALAGASSLVGGPFAGTALALANNRKPETGTANRRTLPIAGDDADAKALVIQLLDQFGFNTVDVGALPENRRFERDTPAYCVPLDAVGLHAALS